VRVGGGGVTAVAVTEPARHDTPAAVLAVDGGNSKTDVALLDASGRLLAAVHGPTSSHQAIGLEPGLQVLARLVGEAARRAGLPPDARPMAAQGVYCLAGADFPSDLRLLRRGLARAGLASADLVRNDGFAGLRAGTSREWGVAVIMGRGVNVAAVAPDGRTLIHAPGDHTSGDWGGGGEVGERALSAAVRARDGRGPRTVLERLVPAHFSLSRPLDVTREIYMGRISERRLDELPPIVFDAAAGGDAVASGIVEWLAGEAVGLARSAIRQLHLSRLDVEVVLSGGIFRTSNRVFHQRVRSGILAIAPKAQVIRLSAPPVLGAALLGLEVVAPGDAAATERARSSLTHGAIEWVAEPDSTR
jgi:N-acetylglucosamine kinase-like BadF-type ATPase